MDYSISILELVERPILDEIKSPFEWETKLTKKEHKSFMLEIENKVCEKYKDKPEEVAPASVAEFIDIDILYNLFKRASNEN